LPESLPEVDSFPHVEAENNASLNNEDARPLVGIIYPPPDIRNIVDKTAIFVARNGVQFEERIRENEKHNAKFSFLNPNDPYHAYYQYKIAETKGGKVSKKAEPKELKVEVKEEGFLPRAPPKEPPPFEFMNDMPSISAQDLDILKLTAQFVARNGRKFMTALSQREQRNYQFDFLRPNHSLCNYFTKLVEQYTKVLVPQKNLNEKLKSNVDNKYQILELAYASIDWHDFVIVETVEFTEADETIDLPPPMSIIELENMTLAQKKMASVNIVETHEDKAAEIDMEMDEDVDMEEEEDDQAAVDDDDQDQELTPTVTEIKPPDTSAPMKIVKDYVPKPYAPKATTERQTVICPRCNQAVPVDEMDNHVRIELLDPKWKEQKMAADAKKKESNLLQEGTDVAKILKTFSGYRSDIFGNEETEIGRKIGEEEEKKKRIEKEKVVWDGMQPHISSTQQPIFTGYPSHTTQNVPIPPGPLPVAYSGYVGSSAPFAHQLPGFIAPIAPQNVNMTSQQPSQVRPPIPPIPQLRQSLPENNVLSSARSPELGDIVAATQRICADILAQALDDEKGLKK
ncbi:8929_t:CDS:10, partial [Racocetra fulgida]